MDGIPAPEQPPARAWTRARREEFVEVAVRHLETPRPDGEDPEPLSIRLVASLLGKSPSAPLFHFPDRRTLLAAVAAEGFTRMADVLRPLAQRCEGEDPPLRRVAQAYVEWAAAHPMLFVTMYERSLAAGIDAIQRVDEDYWRRFDALSTNPAAEQLTTAAGRRRRAFRDLYLAKAAAVQAFEEASRASVWTGREAVHRARVAAALANGLAWEWVTEGQVGQHEHARDILKTVS
jgi:AcrR family transcriptional regulator